jgi:hypothetical protein
MEPALSRLANCLVRMSCTTHWTVGTTVRLGVIRCHGLRHDELAVHSDQGATYPQHPGVKIDVCQPLLLRRMTSKCVAAPAEVGFRISMVPFPA